MHALQTKSLFGLKMALVRFSHHLGRFLHEGCFTISALPNKSIFYYDRSVLGDLSNDTKVIRVPA